VKAVQLEDEARVEAALGAARVVAEGPYAVDQDLVDLELAGTVEQEG
jgi:hypothetical protein